MKLAILAAFVMLMGLAGIMVSTILRVTESYTDESIDYGIILDAGSTSTKAYIYEWRHKISDVLPQVTLSMKDSKPLSYKVKPGIDTLAPNYTQVGIYLDPIIEWARDNIPNSRRDETPIFFRGTGGLRQLSGVSGAALLTNVRFKLQESSFYFENSFASILTSTEEAGYGFVSVNALYNKFQRADDVITPALFGSLDMGGVSSDISFPSSGVLPPNSSFSIDLNATTFNVFAQAIDGLGINAARYLLNISFFQNSTANTAIDPCAPFGYYENVTTMVGGFEHTFLLIGNSNAEGCKLAIQNLVTSMTSSLPQVPKFGDTIFVLADHYLEVKDFFKLKDNANLLELSAKASSFCQLSYGDALSHAAKRYADEVQNFCFMGTYINVLLTQYYGISPTLRHLFWKDTVNKMPVTWSLGAMLDHVSTLTPDTTPQSHEQVMRFFHTDGGLVVLFISILVFLLGLVLFIVQRRRTNDYTLIN